MLSNKNSITITIDKEEAESLRDSFIVIKDILLHASNKKKRMHVFFDHAVFFQLIDTVSEAVKEEEDE